MARSCGTIVGATGGTLHVRVDAGAMPEVGASVQILSGVEAARGTWCGDARQALHVARDATREALIAQSAAIGDASGRLCERMLGLLQALDIVIAEAQAFERGEDGP